MGDGDRPIYESSLEPSIASVGASRVSPAKDVRVGGINVIASDGTSLLRNADICLKAGTVNALCGRSGSGKMTLLRALHQLRQRGVSVSIAEGESQLRLMPKAYLRQKDAFSAFGRLVPAEYLFLTAKLYGCSDVKFRELCSFAERLFGRRPEVDIMDAPAHFLGNKKKKRNSLFFDTKIKNLSGGQQRILSIALTLLGDPELILLDESLSGLDAFSGLQVMHAIKTIAEYRGCTVLMIVHQPSDTILEHFDRLIILDAGTITFNESVRNRTASTISRILDDRLKQSFGSMPSVFPDGRRSVYSTETGFGDADLTRTDGLPTISESYSTIKTVGSGPMSFPLVSLSWFLVTL
jgi:ABC-type multidrug transport system ATPase subunit